VSGSTGRRTNLALLGLLALAFASGSLTFVLGAPSTRWTAVAHGVASLAILVAAPWKSVVVRRGWRRARPGRAASAVLAGLAVVVVATGLAHSTGLWVGRGQLAPMFLHVGAALLLLPFAARHVIARPQRPRATDLSRRALLRTGAGLASAGALYGAIEGVVRLADLPGADRRFTGSLERGSYDPAALPTVQWLDDRPPTLDLGTWTLTVDDGRSVHHLSYPELAAFDARVEATLDCTSGWFSTQRWEGARLADLLHAAQGRSLVVSSTTGYQRRFPLGDAGHLLLATRIDGEPLSRGHGAPARLVAPGRRGFWWVKWVRELRVSERPWWLDAPLPLT
jgi:hypothetical protein